ncbi:hypothetical protein PGIN_13-1_00757 [Porphyromonas gingivalis]|nr:hypothetical protein PGIN_13-1_00757 [Porphyromonas gingivalis]
MDCINGHEHVDEIEWIRILSFFRYVFGFALLLDSLRPFLGFFVENLSPRFKKRRNSVNDL